MNQEPDPLEVCGFPAVSWTPGGSFRPAWECPNLQVFGTLECLDQAAPCRATIPELTVKESEIHRFNFP